MKHHVEIKQLIGQFREPRTGAVRSLAWEMDRVFLNGVQVATINRVPGSPVGTFPGTMLTASQVEAIADAVAAVRGGVKPSKVSGPTTLAYQLLDEESSEDDYE